MCVELKDFVKQRAVFSKKHLGGQQNASNSILDTTYKDIPDTEDVFVFASADWRGSLGAQLPAASKIRIRLVGNQSKPVIAIMGGISANRFVTPSVGVKGWWPGLVGKDAAIDPEKFRIASMDFVVGEGAEPLKITPEDQADLFFYALQQVGIEYLHAFVGASFGGMVGLSFARKFPTNLKQLVVLCAAHRPSPQAQGWRIIQRQILASHIKAGCPQEGVAQARGLAMMSYRTSSELNDRFSCDQEPDSDIGAYLLARGLSFSEEMSAIHYLTLSAAIDHHFEQPEFIKTPCLLIASEQDQIVPIADMQDLSNRLAAPNHLVRIASIYGHDAFLKEINLINPHIKNFISETS